MEQSVRTELVNGIVKAVGEKLIRIVLYGSVARGTDTEDSDVDIALLMQGGLDAETEDRLSDFIVEMDLKYDRVFSVIDIDYQQYQDWLAVLPFYQNVKQEGVVLWTAA